MLKPLGVDQIEARGMDSIAVLNVPPEWFASVANWTFAPGGDDLDDFDAAVFEVGRWGSFGVLRYHGQPKGTTSVLAPADLARPIKRRLLRIVLRTGVLNDENVTWSAVGGAGSGAQPPRTNKLVQRKRAPQPEPRRKAIG